MSTSIRISSSGPRTPAGGIIGAFGGTTPGESIDVNVETDDLSDVGDIVHFVQDATPSAVAAFLRVTTDEPLIDAEVVDEPGDEDEPETTDDSTVYYKGQEFTPAQWAAVEAYAASEEKRP